MPWNKNRYEGWAALVGLVMASVFVTMCQPAQARPEGPQACVEIPIPTGPPYKTFVDGSNFVIQYRVAEREHPDLELHMLLLPKSQWKDPETPAFLVPPLSYWVDTDGIKGYDEWWLDGAGTGDCKNFLHFVWNGQLQTWVLKEGGKGT